MFETLQEWLLGRNLKGQTSVLIIDEAQNLSTEVFEVVRALSNLETPTEELLQIILSGQREIEETLRRPELKPVTQRITLRLRTCPLSPAETLQYIAHRLRVAGGNVETVFTPEAGMAVSWSSAGIPRLINLICEHALISGYADQRKPIGAETIWEVAREFALGVATWGEEAVADEGLGPLETGALTQPITEITNLAGPPRQPAPRRVPPESHETPMPAGARANCWRLPGTASPDPSGGMERQTCGHAQVPTSKPADPRFQRSTHNQRRSKVPDPVSVMPLPAPSPAEVQKSSRPPTPASPVIPEVTAPAPGASNRGIHGSTIYGSAGANGKPFRESDDCRQSPADSQAAAKDTSVASSERPQPVLLKKVPGGRGFVRVDNAHLPGAGGRPGALRWAALVLVFMGVVRGGYYLAASGLLVKTRWGHPPNARIHAAISEKFDSR